MNKSKPTARTQSVGGDAQLTAKIAAKNFQSPSDAPDWSRTCSVCGSRPDVPLTGMCGPCTFGEAETAGGNW
jgi:hypothetical protein